MAAEEIADLVALDAWLKRIKAELKAAVLERGSTLMDIYGEQNRHRPSRAGNRRMNHVLHVAAIVQIRHDTEGRAYCRHRLAAGKTPSARSA